VAVRAASGLIENSARVGPPHGRMYQGPAESSAGSFAFSPNLDAGITEAPKVERLDRPASFARISWSVANLIRKSRMAPSAFAISVSISDDVTREKELICELAPACNQRVG